MCKGTGASREPGTCVTAITAVNVCQGGVGGGEERYKGTYTLSCQLLEGHEQGRIVMQLADPLIFTEEDKRGPGCEMTPPGARSKFMYVPEPNSPNSPFSSLPSCSIASSKPRKFLKRTLNEAPFRERPHQDKEFCLGLFGMESLFHLTTQRLSLLICKLDKIIFSTRD